MSQIVKHHVEVAGVFIHCNFPITDDNIRLESFLHALRQVEGVETVKIDRYRMYVGFGFLFDALDCTEKVFEVFSNYWTEGEHIFQELTTDDLVTKAERFAKNSDQKEANLEAMLNMAAEDGFREA